MKHKIDKSKKIKLEIEKFIRKGGTITVVPPSDEPPTKHIVRSTSRQNPNLMSLSEGALFFSEKIKRMRTKYKEILKSDLIPQSLRKKLLGETDGK